MGLDQKIPLWASDVAASILAGVHKKDPFTFFHCCRVGRAARLMGVEMGMPEYDLALLEFSGLFHDIGKIGVPDSILLKPARLTPEEVIIMQNHAEMSVQMIRPLTREEFFRHLIPGVRFHHERFDGGGYPMNLAGEKIPLFARILAVVDTVDAMLNTRPYRNALTMDHVKKELVEFSGTQFDPKIAQLYLQAAPRWLEAGTMIEGVREVVVGDILEAA